MILVRVVFNAKWGKASELAKQVVDDTRQMAAATGVAGRTRVLTDLSGRFHTVVLELEVPSLGDWEQIRRQVFSSSQFEDESARSDNLIESGYQEYYTVEAEF